MPSTNNRLPIIVGIAVSGLLTAAAILLSVVWPGSLLLPAFLLVPAFGAGYSTFLL